MACNKSHPLTSKNNWQSAAGNESVLQTETEQLALREWMESQTEEFKHAVPHH